MKSQETGWSWFIVCCSFVVQMIVGGITYSCGVLQMIFVNYFDADRFDVSLITSILLSTTMLAGIPGMLIAYRFSCRVSVICGSCLAASGFVFSTFCYELYQVYVTIGVFVGVGLGLALTPSVMVIDEYFKDNRFFASNVAATGISLGAASFPVAFYLLERHFAWKGTSLVFSAISLNILVCGVSMASNNRDCRKRYAPCKVFDPKALLSLSFDLLLLCNVFWSLGSTIVVFHIIEFVSKTGLTTSESIILVAVAGMSGLVSRVVFQFFSHSAKLDPASNCLCSAGLALLLTGLVSEFFKHKAGEISYAILFGLHCGFWSTFIATVAQEMWEEERVTLGHGYVNVAVAIGVAAAPPFTSWILSIEENFEIVFYLAGTCMLCGSILLIIVSLKKCHYQRLVEDTEASTSLNNALKEEREEQEILLA